MRVPLDEKFLRWAEQAVGTACLVQMIQEDLARQHPGQTQTAFLNRLGIRAQWQRAIVDGKIADYGLLATVVRVAELPVSILTRTPWHLIQPGDEIAVVQGVRAVDIPEVSRAVRQRGVGARDALAQAAIANACRRLRLDADLMPHPVPGEWPVADGTRYLTELCAKPNVGAVIVLGSFIVNPLAEPLARRALAGQPCPARFRWVTNPGAGNVLSVPGAAPPGQEGIQVDRPAELFPRMRDDAVLERLNKSDTGPFPDCGLLLIDARTRPLTILCAGHGGCGTVAAAETLGDHALITRLLAASADAENSALGANLVLVVVAVDRQSSGGMGLGGSPVDDLVIARRRVVWSSTLIEDLDL